MKLYYSKGACSLSVRIIIHELRIMSSFEPVDLKTKKTSFGTDFLKINPKGVVPVLELDSGEILTENVAIHCYLADNFEGTYLLPVAGNINRYHVVEWLSFISSDVHKGFSPLFNPTIPQDIKNNIFKPNLRKKLNYINHHLSSNNYLMKDQFTLPDAYLYVVLRWLSHFEMDIKEWPHVQRYFDGLKTRGSIAQSLKEEGLEI